MRNLYVALCALVVLLLPIGCGQDGEDGEAFLSFSWDWTVDGYTDNNGSIPTLIERDRKYRTMPGNYSFAYACSDGSGSYWSFNGQYTISINKGGDGGLLKNGKDGGDRRFHIYLGRTGPSVQGGRPAGSHEPPGRPLAAARIKIEPADTCGCDQWNVLQTRSLSGGSITIMACMQPLPAPGAVPGNLGAEDCRSTVYRMASVVSPEDTAVSIVECLAR